MKKIVMILLLGILVAGCGTSNGALDQPAEKVNGGGNGIVANKVEAALAEKSPLVFQYEVKNQTEEVVNLEFTSSQRFDYLVKDKAGKEIFLFSSVASFLQVMGKETIVQGDVLSYEIDLNELDLEKGEYVLSAWMTPRDGKKYEVSKDFSVK